MTRMRALTICGAIALAATISQTVSAQWPDYKVPGVPRLPDGKVDMAAATPRTADGKPDLSGVWQNVGFGGGGRRGAPPAPGSIPLASFFDTSLGFPGGLPFQPWAKELRDKRNAANSKDNPDALCLPMGNMQFHTHPQPRKIIQAPGAIVILYEGNAGIRQILTDGRPSPDNDPNPTWYGYSVGKWDGDTLVVETTGFRDDGWLDIVGSPFTDKSKWTEKFRRTNVGTLEIEITVDDPKAYTKPWTVRLTQRLMPDAELIEFVCAENQKFDDYLRGDLRPKP